MEKHFDNFDLANFWKDSDYARKEYVGEEPTDAMVLEIEEELGYKLPASYVELMHSQNGGLPESTCFPTSKSNSWAEDHVVIHGFLGIGREKSYSLCGDLGSQFMMQEWGYPNIGIYFGDCPSAGHDMLCLDYRGCGPNGEPVVVHVDEENDYEITHLANSFEEFVEGLVNKSQFEDIDM
ncbi:SMI1/KNR4 family protein [Vibrio parahaemolyticus]